MTLDELLARFEGVRRSGKGYSCKCASHDDKRNSLSVDQADEKILIKCHAGCDTESILAAVGLEMKDLFTSNGNGNGNGYGYDRDYDPVVETYPYHDENGKLLYRICRTASKNFKAQRYESGAFTWGIKDVRRVLYNLPAVIKAKSVIVVEGEKDVETLRKLELVATTNPFGAGKWDDSYNQFFKNKRIGIIPDNDDPGRAHGWRIAKSIIPDAESVRLVELPDVPEKGDVTDYLAKHAKEDLLSIVKAAKLLTAEDVEEHEKSKANDAEDAEDANDAEDAEDSTEATIKIENLTDLGNAKRFAALHAGNVFYSAERKKWIFWNGKIWEWDVVGKINDLAEAVLRSIYAEAAEAKKKERRLALAKHATKTESRRQIEAMLALAQTRPEIRTRLSVFDRDPYLFNAANVTIDLRSGQPREFNREDYITRISPTAYDSQAECPRFEKFMDEITVRRPELVGFIQRAAGYSLTDATKEQCIVILHGGGGNGKSTLAVTLTSVLGPDYTQQIKAEILCQSKHDSSTEYHIAELAGMRMALACESELRRRLASALIKQWTGGEPLVGRRPYELPIRFTPIAKLWFSTNHLPKIDDTTDSIWRRIYTIPFDAKFDAGKREQGYETKLLSEASGILNWLIQGCLDWQKTGLNSPEIVMSRTKNYRSEEDLVGNFIQEKCVVKPEEWVNFADLYEAYSKWCEAEGEWVETATALGRALTEKGFAPEKNKGIRGRQGLRLRKPEDPVEES